MLAQASELRRRARTRVSAPHGQGSFPRLIMNDRSDLCLAAEFDGRACWARRSFSRGCAEDRRPGALAGSFHAQSAAGVEADKTSADYIAIGPVFATGSKTNPDPVIGLAGVRQARALTRKPLVAIGGITRENCRSVIDAGADSVAVISDLIREPRKSAEEFLRILG